MREPLEIKHGEQVLGLIKPYDIDFPWVQCKFEPYLPFAEYKPLFDEELRVIEDPNDDLWTNAYQKIEDLGLCLVPVDGSEILNKFLLHIDRDEAWFRY